MMIHPADRTMVEDWSLAGQKVNIRYYGKPAHCAASPWLGANALAAAGQTMSMVNAWRCQFKDYSSSRDNRKRWKPLMSFLIMPKYNTMYALIKENTWTS